MPSSVTSSLVRFLLALWALCFAGCFSGELVLSSECNYSDSTETCCLKQFPGEYQRCVGVEPFLNMGKKATYVYLLSRLQDNRGPILPQEDEEDSAERTALEAILVRCARQAEREVNQWMFRQDTVPDGRCGQQYTVDSQGRIVTWAMHLGLMMHAAVGACIKKELGPRWAEYFTLEPRYRLKPESDTVEFLSAEEVQRIMAENRWEELEGTFVPDIVFHARGNPLIIKYLYDFKFPCPRTNFSSWYRFPEGHPLHPYTQGNLYSVTVGGKPALVSPAEGVKRYE